MRYSQVTELNDIVKGEKTVGAAQRICRCIDHHRNKLRQFIVADIIQHNGLRLRRYTLTSIRLYKAALQPNVAQKTCIYSSMSSRIPLARYRQQLYSVTCSAGTGRYTPHRMEWMDKGQVCLPRQ